MILHSSDSCEIGFDIETVKDVDMIDKLPKPKVKYGNTKDPAKRKIMDEKAKGKQVADMALNPFYGRICSYAVYGNEGRISKYSVLTEINDSAETNLINSNFAYFFYILLIFDNDSNLFVKFFRILNCLMRLII